MLRCTDEPCHLWIDRAESKGEKRMIGNGAAQLWRPMLCCLWPYWKLQSQSTQSPFRAWINSSWLDFGGLLCCFCLLWHRPSLCEVSMLLSDKGTTSFWGGREKWGDRNWGRGIIEKGASRLFLVFPCCVVLSHAVVCVCVWAGVNLSICPFTLSLRLCAHVTATHWQSLSNIC